MENLHRLNMTDEQLLEHTRGNLKREAALDLEIIEDLRELHRRKLYLAHGSRSFHAYCTEVLGMSSDSAWRRMHAASLADRFPDVVKPLIAEGKVHLTGLALLDRVITPDNGERLLKEAVGKSVTEIKAIVAREAPEASEASVRKLPTRQLSPDTWRFSANMDAETHALLNECEDVANNHDHDFTLREALKAYREVLRIKKQKGLKRPSASPTASMRQDQQSSPQPTRSHPPHDPRDPRVPRWMEREVRSRDGHRCTFVGHGGRCRARTDLQVHHIKAIALGGLTEHANLTLHCGAHNRFQAELDLGRAVANAWKRSA